MSTKNTKQYYAEIRVVALKELINEAVWSIKQAGVIELRHEGSFSKEQPASTPERHQEIKRYAEEKLGVELPD